MTSTQEAHSHDNREPDLLDHNSSGGDDDSTPLIYPETLPVTVTHLSLSSKGKIEMVQLSSESSSVNPTVKDSNEEQKSRNDSNVDDKEIMILDAPSSFAPSTNPFTSLCLESENNANDSNPFEGYDQITSILLNSTNPFHNPFLMPTDVEVKERPEDQRDSKKPLKPDVKSGEIVSVAKETFNLRTSPNLLDYLLPVMTNSHLFFSYCLFDQTEMHFQILSYFIST